MPLGSTELYGTLASAYAESLRAVRTECDGAEVVTAPAVGVEGRRVLAAGYGTEHASSLDPCEAARIASRSRSRTALGETTLTACGVTSHRDCHSREQDIAVLLLILVSSEATDDLNAELDDLTTAVGWRFPDHPTRWAARSAVRDTEEVLEWAATGELVGHRRRAKSPAPRSAAGKCGRTGSLSEVPTRNRVSAPRRPARSRSG